MGIKYGVNETFFDEWDHEMSYVLGFWCADGSLENAPYLRGKYVRVTSTDKEIITAIKQSLGSEHKIVLTTSSVKPRYMLRIGSHALFDSLLARGLTTNKSLTMLFPKVPPEYLADFMRGYFDGDGSVRCEHAKGKRQPVILKRLSVTFTSGSEKFLDQMSETLHREWDLKRYRPYKSRGAYQVRYSTMDSVALFEHFYCGDLGKLYLKRKFTRFEEYFTLRPQRVSRKVANILFMA